MVLSNKSNMWKVYGQIDGPTFRQADRQTHGQTDRQMPDKKWSESFLELSFPHQNSLQIWTFNIINFQVYESFIIIGQTISVVYFEFVISQRAKFLGKKWNCNILWLYTFTHYFLDTLCPNYLQSFKKFYATNPLNNRDLSMSSLILIITFIDK